jgi:hypothetical protein
MSFWKRSPQIIEVEVKVEKTVTETVLGSPVEVELYAAMKTEWVSGGWCALPVSRVLGYFHSCSDALTAHPGDTVKRVKLWRVGDVYLESLNVVNISHLVDAKPKVSKSKREAP